MSGIKQLAKALEDRSDKFLEYNLSAPSQLDFKQECLFARQALTANSYLCGIAQGNQLSLIDAIYNVASIGISLNPSRAHAYLVPRKVGGVLKVCLDISYRGLLKLATDSGVTKYMKAELVYENDEFEYMGFDQRPVLKCNPFKDRGSLIGGYAMAVLHDDSVLVENMTVDQINSIRDDSEAYKGSLKKGGYHLDNCVWVKFYEEMAKKTIIKRAFKTLPETNGKYVIDKAVEVINEHEGIEFNHANNEEFTADESLEYSRCLDNSDFTGLLSLRETLSIEANNQLCNLHEIPRIEKGSKGKYFAQMDENFKVARSLRDDNLQALIDLINSDDSEGIKEIIEECNEYEKDWYLRKLNAEQQLIVNESP